MNSNAFHNILNVLIAVIAALTAFDWTVVVSQGQAATILSVLATVKILVNVFRDGIKGLTKPQPPVVQ